MFHFYPWRTARNRKTSARDRRSRAALKLSYQPKVEDLEDRLVPDATNTLVTAPSSAYAGQPVTVNVTVTSDGGVPTGYVKLFDNNSQLGMGMLAGGQKDFTSLQFYNQSAEDDGVCAAHILTSHYFGDSTFDPSDSSPTCISIYRNDTDLTLESSDNPSIDGELVTFTATVSVRPQGGGTPTGTVLFEDGTNILGQDDLDQAGQAHFATADLTEGDHTITAVYEGDANDRPSSAMLVQTVLSQSHGPAAMLTFEAPDTVSVNTPFVMTVSAVDFSGHVDFDYGDTIAFASSDPAAGLPADYTYLPADRGIHRFTAFLGTPGEQVIWAIDSDDSTISGSAIITVVGGDAPPSGRGPGLVPPLSATAFVANHSEQPSAVLLAIPMQLSTNADPVEYDVETITRSVQSRRGDEHHVALTRPVAATAQPGFLDVADNDGIPTQGLVPSWPEAILREPATRESR
jgi:hypothetical protein